jgi:uncharacterized repeat protein (TIGR01451 family)
VFTLDGDPGNSTQLNNVDEALRFNGNLLDDGLVPAGSVPTVQQFDGTINTQGVVTSYGVDVDQYDISAFLNPGATSGTTLYSAGADLVLLMAQVVSATSDPAVDLSITKTHAGTFVSGGTGQYTITVSNAAGLEREDNTVTVTDTLPTGYSFNAGTGTGWTCSAAGQVVTCTHAPTLNSGASFPALTLTVNVLETAAASVNHTVTVSSPSFDFNAANNTATDATTVVFPNLSTSTKSVVDLNGGEAQPGDTLRYTVTLIESAGFPSAGVSVTDHIPANTTFSSVVSIPAGATSSVHTRAGRQQQQGHPHGHRHHRAREQHAHRDLRRHRRQREPGRAGQQPGHGHESQWARRHAVGADDHGSAVLHSRPRRHQAALPVEQPGTPDANAAVGHARPDHDQQQRVADLHDERAVAGGAHAQQHQLRRDAPDGAQRLFDQQQPNRDGHAAQDHRRRHHRRGDGVANHFSDGRRRRPRTPSR